MQRPQRQRRLPEKLEDFVIETGPKKRTAAKQKKKKPADLKPAEKCEDSISISTSSINADQEDDSFSGNVAALVVSNQEYESGGGNASKGDEEQHELALQETGPTISTVDLHQKSMLASSGCVLCELVGGNVNGGDGKILATEVQFNRVKKVLEEELLAADKLRETLKKMLDDLEALKISE